jgi:hypothetical protein
MRSFLISAKKTGRELVVYVYAYLYDKPSNFVATLLVNINGNLNDDLLPATSHLFVFNGLIIRPIP